MSLAGLEGAIVNSPACSLMNIPAGSSEESAHPPARGSERLAALHALSVQEPETKLSYFNSREKAGCARSVFAALWRTCVKGSDLIDALLSLTTSTLYCDPIVPVGDNCGT